MRCRFIVGTVFFTKIFTKMFKLKIKRLLEDFGVKQEAIIELIESNRVTFGKKLESNTFTDREKELILNKYGALL